MDMLEFCSQALAKNVCSHYYYTTTYYYCLSLRFCRSMLIRPCQDPTERREAVSVGALSLAPPFLRPPLMCRPRRIRVSYRVKKQRICLA